MLAYTGSPGRLGLPVIGLPHGPYHETPHVCVRLSEKQAVVSSVSP